MVVAVKSSDKSVLHRGSAECRRSSSQAATATATDSASAAAAAAAAAATVSASAAVESTPAKRRSGSTRKTVKGARVRRVSSSPAASVAAAGAAAAAAAASSAACISAANGATSASSSQAGTAAKTAKEPPPFDRFERVRELGRGACGVVWLVRCRTSQRLLAMKSIPLPPLATKDAKAIAERKQVLREVDILKDLKSMHVLRHEETILAFSPGSGCSELHILTEFCDAGDLASFLQKAYEGPGLTESEVWGLGASILAGLLALHAGRVLHRDLKPANIFLKHLQHPTKGSQLRRKLLLGSRKRLATDSASRFDPTKLRALLGDLGIARTVSASQPMAETILGTPLYCAPELFEGEPYNEKADIYSFGICMYELMHGTPPWSNVQNIAGLVRHVLQLDGEPGEHEVQMSSRFSQELRTLVRDCMSRHPQDRPSALELVERFPSEHIRAAGLDPEFELHDHSCPDEEVASNASASTATPGEQEAPLRSRSEGRPPRLPTAGSTPSSAAAAFAFRPPSRSSSTGDLAEDSHSHPKSAAVDAVEDDDDDDDDRHNNSVAGTAAAALAAFGSDCTQRRESFTGDDCSEGDQDGDGEKTLLRPSKGLVQTPSCGKPPLTPPLTPDSHSESESGGDSLQAACISSLDPARCLASLLEAALELKAVPSDASLHENSKPDHFDDTTTTTTMQHLSEPHDHCEETLAPAPSTRSALQATLGSDVEQPLAKILADVYNATPARAAGAGVAAQGTLLSKPPPAAVAVNTKQNAKAKLQRIAPPVAPVVFPADTLQCDSQDSARPSTGRSSARPQPSVRSKHAPSSTASSTCQGHSASATTTGASAPRGYVAKAQAYLARWNRERKDKATSKKAVAEEKPNLEIRGMAPSSATKVVGRLGRI